MAKKNKENDIVTDGSRAITKFHVSDVVMVVILVILCATCVVPFIHLLAKSVSSNTAVLAKRVSFWPIGFNLDAYTSIFEDGSMVSSFLYSVIVTLVFTLMGMIACTCAAYPLSRKRLKGRTFFTFILMFPMYFSAGLIPTYLLYSDLHMLDTVWVLILPLIYAPYNMLIMKPTSSPIFRTAWRRQHFLTVQQTSRSSGKLYFRCQSQFWQLCHCSMQ